MDVDCGDVDNDGDIEVWINDGNGVFSTAAASPFSAAPAGSAFDIEVVDLNADGKNYIYFCYCSGTDQLYLRQ